MNREEIFSRDVFILLSIVNMKLRDYYDTLDKYCYEEEVDKASLEERFKEAGYHYSQGNNAFIQG